jgi:hypothetical protein
MNVARERVELKPHLRRSKSAFKLDLGGQADVGHT